MPKRDRQEELEEDYLVNFQSNLDFKNEGLGYYARWPDIYALIMIRLALNEKRITKQDADKLFKLHDRNTSPTEIIRILGRIINDNETRAN